MLLTLVRHGQSEGNRERRIRGWGGGSLTFQGRQEAEHTARLLVRESPFHVLYSSPLSRALETATIIGGRIGLRPLAVSELRELNVGVVDGLNREEAESAFPGLMDRWRGGDPTLVFPQGEALADFYQRARKVFEALVAEHPLGHVLVVSHVCLMSAFLTQLLEGQPSIRLAWELWNCSVTQLEFCDGLTALRCFNYHGHLDDLYTDQN